MRCMLVIFSELLVMPKYEMLSVTEQMLQYRELKRQTKLSRLILSLIFQAIPSVVKSINSSGMNLNSQQDGTMVYVKIPK